jgi:hypothetical protein
MPFRSSQPLPLRSTRFGAAVIVVITKSGSSPYAASIGCASEGALPCTGKCLADRGAPVQSGQGERAYLQLHHELSPGNAAQRPRWQ